MTIVVQVNNLIVRNKSSDQMNHLTTLPLVQIQILKTKHLHIGRSDSIQT